MMTSGGGDGNYGDISMHITVSGVIVIYQLIDIPNRFNVPCAARLPQKKRMQNTERGKLIPNSLFSI